MRYFFVKPDHVTEAGLVLQQETAHHIRHVLRKKPGEILHVSDGVSALYQVVIDGFSKGEIHCTIQKRSPLADPPGPRVLLLSSLPKGNRMDWLIQKATEVGVAEIMPVTMKRSVREIAPKKADHWMCRWEKIALSAASQCGRAEFPVIHCPRLLSEVLPDQANVSLKIFADPGEGSTFYDRFTPSSLRNRIAVVIGPEGGMTVAEKDLLLKNGFTPVTLGNTVLRVETAGVLAVALARYEWQRGRQLQGKLQS